MWQGGRFDDAPDYAKEALRAWAEQTCKQFVGQLSPDTLVKLREILPYDPSELSDEQRRVFAVAREEFKAARRTPGGKFLLPERPRRILSPDEQQKVIEILRRRSSEAAEAAAKAAV